MYNDTKPVYKAQCPFCTFYTEEINKVQRRSAMVIHHQEYHKISDPLTSIHNLIKSNQ